MDISLRAVLLGDELLTIGAIRDMSAQRHAEGERAQQAEHLRLHAELLDLSHDAILIRDSASRVIFWNTGRGGALRLVIPGGARSSHP